MKTKLVVSVLGCAALGCTLETNGMGFPEDAHIDVDTDPGIGEDISDEFIAEDSVDEASGEDETPDTEDVEPDELDVPDVEEAEDAIEAEDADEVEDIPEVGDADEGEEFIDPCVPPEIPTTSRIWLFFCLDEEGPVEMILWRWIQRDWAPTIPWEREPGCSRGSTTTMWCSIEYYHTANFYFNIEMPGLGIGWACGPGLTAPYGKPLVWLDGVELPVSIVTNGDGGCNFLFSVP